MNMNLKRFMVRAVIALYPGLSRKGIRVIIRGITNDRQHEQEIEFFHKKTSRKRKNEAYVIRAAIIEHRAVLGLVNPQEKISDRKKDEERCYPLILRNFVFFDRELERKADMELSRGKCAVGETQGCGSGEAPQYRSIMLRQVTRCDYRLHNPLYHHEGDQSRVQCKQGEVHPRRRENLPDEYLRFQAPQHQQEKVIHWDDRKRWSSRVWRLSALEGGSPSSVIGFALGEA